jgi:hypothetical protein
MGSCRQHAKTAAQAHAVARGEKAAERFSIEPESEARRLCSADDKGPSAPAGFYADQFHVLSVLKLVPLLVGSLNHPAGMHRAVQAFEENSGVAVVVVDELKRLEQRATLSQWKRMSELIERDNLRHGVPLRWASTWWRSRSPTARSSPPISSRRSASCCLQS